MRHAARLAPLAAFTAATGLVVVLVRQKQSLEAPHFELAARLHDPYVGMYVPAVRALCVEANSLLIGESWEGKRQVLFVFAISCPYSTAALPSWKAVAGRVAGEPGLGVYGVSVDSLDATRAYAITHGLTFPVVTLTEPKAHALYHLRQVPQTLILDAEGRVVYSRPGVVEREAVVDSIVAAAQAP